MSTYSGNSPFGDCNLDTCTYIIWCNHPIQLQTTRGTQLGRNVCQIVSHGIRGGLGVKVPQHCRFASDRGLLLHVMPHLAPPLFPVISQLLLSNKGTNNALKVIVL